MKLHCCGSITFCVLLVLIIPVCITTKIPAVLKKRKANVCFSGEGLLWLLFRAVSVCFSLSLPPLNLLLFTYLTSDGLNLVGVFLGTTVGAVLSLTSFE